MNEGKHTDLPWDYDGEDTVASEDWGGDGYEIFRRDADGNVAEPIGVVLEEEDAAFIVKAANAHEGLKEALRKFVAFDVSAYTDKSVLASDYVELKRSARAELAKAEET